ncbi:hypothetical protein JD844_026683 [Phrynosoma platyrhinos]|uniref:Uncharacterized protein n=1 Tax=Phrynosoma platyrhinos TaxID=52577 RepID=A0ABQ7SF79_PHRPL|nr:hypothetical protein JD844_026683 [Phrynosoma platyrhinos]
MEFKIEHTWNSLPVSHDPIVIKLTPENSGILMEVSAPFFNDPPAPPGELGKPFSGLWDYEVVEAFFLNGQTQQYLEVELCPHGQHLVLLLSGRRKVCKVSKPYYHRLEYFKSFSLKLLMGDAWKQPDSDLWALCKHSN